jgi:hypothetical protein
LLALKLKVLDFGQVELLVTLLILMIITTVVIQSLTSVKITKNLEQFLTAPYFFDFSGVFFLRLFADYLLINCC